jgi:small subunit ribosomal protein S6
MNRSYEIVLVFDAYQQEDRLNTSLESLEKFITDNGGIIAGKNRWGKRRLAYEINKRQHGLYICLLVETENYQLIQALEAQIRLREEILRYLSIKMDQKMLKYPSPRSALINTEASDTQEKAPAAAEKQPAADAPAAVEQDAQVPSDNEEATQE